MSHVWWDAIMSDVWCGEISPIRPKNSAQELLLCVLFFRLVMCDVVRCDVWCLVRCDDVWCVMWRDFAYSGQELGPCDDVWCVMWWHCAYPAHPARELGPRTSSLCSLLSARDAWSQGDVWSPVRCKKGVMWWDVMWYDEFTGFYGNVAGAEAWNFAVTLWIVFALGGPRLPDLLVQRSSTCCWSKKDVDLSCCVLCTLVRGTDDTKDLTMLMQLIFHSCWYRHTCSLWSVVSRPFSFSDYTVMEPFIAVRGVTTLFALWLWFVGQIHKPKTLWSVVSPLKIVFYFIILHCLGSLAGIIFDPK